MRTRVSIGVIVVFAFSLLVTPTAHAAQVSSGLLIDLMASNPSSYPGTGTAWIDLAGRDDTATLTNGPVYDTATGAGFTNDGVNDYINIPNRAALQPSTSSCSTMMLWAKVLSATNYDGLMGKMFAATSYDGYALLQSGTLALTLKMNGTSVDQTVASASNVYSLNTWTLFSFVTCFGGNTTNPSKVYVNTSVVITANNTESGVGAPTAPIQLANGMQDGLEYGNVKIGAFAFYNRALSATEIADSYDYYSNYVYVQEVSSISLQISGNPLKGNSFTISATVGAAGRVRFLMGGKRIQNCLNVQATGAPLTATCTWKPALSGNQAISATLTPINAGLGSSSDSKLIFVGRRSNQR
ncbi:Concanavalin A-like lectin/glucanases superfamily [Candidatus Nanopelagicaceae bacterium]